MSTPVFTKKQQRKALSAKKTPAKGLRNVLAQPYERYWPVLNNDDKGDLEKLLKRSMPAVKRTSAAIPWAQLRKMKKAERHAARKEAEDKLNVAPPDKDILDSIVMGVNAVTRLLEKNDACCVLLHAKVEPLLLIKHIVGMAVARRVPIILVPFLKRVTSEAIGFACAAFALKKRVEQSTENHFHSLYTKIAELAANFQIPNRPEKLSQVEGSMECSSFVEEKQPTTEDASDKEESLSTNVYKYRSSRKERIFVPESSRKAETTDVKSWGDFIAMEDNTDFSMDDSTRQQIRNSGRYINIHVETKEVSSGSRSDDYISFSSEPEPTVSNRTDNTVSREDSEKLESSEKTSVKTKENKEKFVNDKNNRHSGYRSLKVKRLQGNSNRVKATKVPKSQKK